MTDFQANKIADAIRSTIGGDNRMTPTGMEAITLALVGGFTGTNGDSVASGLHDIASAIRELAEAISNKQDN